MNPPSNTLQVNTLRVSTLRVSANPSNAQHSITQRLGRCRPLMAAAAALLSSILPLNAQTQAQPQADLHDSGHQDLRLNGIQSRYVNFAEGFVFPFGGVPHAGIYVHGNGYVSFGGLGVGDATPTTAELLGREDEFSLSTGIMRIAPLWADLSPDGNGRGKVYAGMVGADFRVTWLDVPFRNATGKTITVSLLLRPNGSFRFSYDSVGSIYGTAICGFAAGHEQTSINGASMDLSQAAAATIGNGTQPHAYEYFSGAFDMDGYKLEFAPVLPTSGVLSLAGDDALEIDLGFAFPYYGNRYRTVWIGSNGELNFVRWSPFAWQQTESGLLDDTARIIPFGADLNPTGNGYVRVTRGNGNVLISWVDLAETEKTNRNTFSVTLRTDGSFSFSYGRIDAPSKGGKVAIGACGGYPVTTENESQTSFVGDRTYGTGAESAIYQIFDGQNTGLGNKSLHFKPFTKKSPLPLMAHYGRGSTCRYDFANGFAFPFAGQRYRTMFINTNGTITFGSGDPSVAHSANDLVDGFPRLAPVWAQHNPKSWQTNPKVEGTITVTESAGKVEVHYNVPLEGKFNSSPLWSQFTVVLESSGDFTYKYGRVDAINAIAGYSTGAVHACTCESMSDLSATTPINRGSEATVWEQFDIEQRFDLNNRTLAFRRVGGVTLRHRAALGSTVGINLAAGVEYKGLEYIHALALSDKVGISLPGDWRFPLDYDPLLEQSLGDTPWFTGFRGRLDHNGRSSAAAVAIPVLKEIVGMPIHSAFLALSPESRGGIAHISGSTVIGVAPQQQAVKKCKVTATTAVVGNAWAITVTTTDAAGNPRAGVLVSCGLYGGNQGNLIMPLQFKNTNGNGTAVFNLNPGVAVPRAFVKGLVAADANCPLLRYRK